MLSRLNSLVAELAAAAERVAAQEMCAYIPLYEELTRRLPSALESTGRPPSEFTAFMPNLARCAVAVVQHKLLGRSWDEISTCVHTHDHMHLNERGGGVLLDLLMPGLEPLSAHSVAVEVERDTGTDIRVPEHALRSHLLS